MERKEREKTINKTKVGLAGGLELFKKSVAQLKKDKVSHEANRKSFIQKYEPESCSQNSDSSKETLNEITVADKSPSIQSQEKEKDFLFNNKLHEDRNNQNSCFKSSIDQSQDVSDVQESRHSRYCNSFNNSSDNKNADYDNFRKSYKSNGHKPNYNYQEKCLQSKDKTFKNLVSSSNSRQSVCQNNNTQTQVHGNHNRLNKHHINTEHNCYKNTLKSDYVNGDSTFDSSNAKTFKHHSNFKHSDSSNTKIYGVDKFSDQKLPYNSKKCIKSSQHEYYRDDFSRRNHSYNSDRCSMFQDDRLQADYKLTQNTEMKNDTKRDSLTSENENIITVDTGIKYQRMFSESSETIMNGKKKNIKITCKLPVNDLESESVSFNVSNVPVSPALNESILSISTVSPVSNASSAVSPIPVSETSSYYTKFDYQNVTDTINELFSSNGNVIPPPVACESAIPSENVCSNAEKSLISFQKDKSEDSYADEAYFSLPDSEHLEAISNFITKIVEEYSVPDSLAVKVVCDLNRFFKNCFEGNVIDYYGSHYCGLAITTSDINLMVEADVSMRKSFMSLIHRSLSRELERYHVYSYEEGETVYKSKIDFTHPDTGISCELAYLGKRKENFLKMGKFFKEMCSKDERTKQLIIVAKVWAERFNINEVEDGKLHPVGFALLVVHYLQHCEKPLLPIYCIEEEVTENLSYNDATIGTLWLGFLRYYAFTFNWQEDILTVTSLHRISKTSKKWENYWIAVEDPFTGKNIAQSIINKDVADYIKCCFKVTYDYFFNGPEIFPSFHDKENESDNESNNSQLKFSFNDCIVGQNENFCEMCDEIDDLCDECKKKIYVQPDIACVPEMTDEFLKIVKKALETIYDKYMLSEAEISQRKQFVKELESKVCKIYPDAEMHLFGSSANGFGFKKSDIDICMTFKSKKQFKAVAVLKDLRNLLRQNKNFTDVIAIFNANIPILKFRYEPEGWRGDISLDNVLAVHNSELLYTYSLIDERCKILGCALKLLAKKALIAEVTEKALSSYSYLIMVIHFLQQTNPPVLPILQDNKFRKDMNTFELGDIIENCNVWFCRDIKHVEKVFKTENNIPVEQLFLYLLDYYCSFDCNQVITINQKEKITICETMRLARLFQIQDPFIVTKNLGCVVSPTKAHETKSVFNRARMLFRTPKKEIPNNDLENYFFSTMSLTGRIQKEALCDSCGKFGHDKNDCKQSSPQKKFFFKYGTRRYQYANHADILKRKQMNRQRFIEKF